MGMREKIAEALYEAPDPLVAESAFGGLVLGEAKRQAKQRADAVMEVVEARVRELEEENTRLRRYLSHAVKFSFGTDMASHAEVTRAEQNRPDGDWFFRSWGPTERHSTQEAALDAALARARQLKEEK